MPINPTVEQRRVLEIVRKHRRVAVHAFAGTGKTSTLRLLAEADNRASLYLAFNKTTAQEAGLVFPRHVTCCTIHSLAYQAMRKRYDRVKLSTRLGAAALARSLDTVTKAVDLGRGSFRLLPIQRASLLINTLQAYAQSDDQEITANHVPLDGARFRGIAPLRAVFAENVAVAARRVWRTMCDPHQDLPLGHDGYLKLWALDKPELKADVILLDEAQDTNPVVVGILRRQSAALVLVGDPHQRIYAWRGATDAMTTLGGVRVHLTGSFRFGPIIAQAATDVLHALNETTPIRGHPAISSKIQATGATRAVLARTNSTLIYELLKGRRARARVHLVGGKRELAKLLGYVERLQAGYPVGEGDLVGFADWADVERWSRMEEGRSLRTLVGLVRDFGTEALISAVAASEPDEASADIVLSTAHKAKGRQWSSVRLCNDFTPIRDGQVDPAEIRLFYVALTRAQHILVADPELLTLFGVVVRS